MILDQLVLVVATCALGAAALRAAAACVGPSLIERLLATAAIAGAFVVCWTLALGLVGLAGSVVALAAGPVAAWAAVRWLMPAPCSSTLEAAVARWAHAARWQRVAAIALAGTAIGSMVAVAWKPDFGVDAVAYHLATVVGWLHSGHAGSAQTFSYDFPVGYYPLTNEVLLTWVLGISRSFAPLAVWSTAVVALLLLAVWRLLDAIRVPRAVAVAAVCAAAVLPTVVVGINATGPGTDVIAVAWLACEAALCAGAVRRPRLLGVAMLAAGLAVGTKTTVAPLALAALAAGAWVARSELRRATQWLLAGGLGAVVVGGPWYVRDTVVHGWPLWPFSSGPTGDRLPHTMSLFSGSFLSRPDATVSATPGLYLKWTAGGLLLIAWTLLFAALARSRTAWLAAAAALLSAVAWMNAPFTGLARNPLLGSLAVTTVRYLLAPLIACVVAIAVAARDGSTRSRRAAIGLFALASIGSLVADVSLGYPNAPLPVFLIVGAVGGTLVGALVCRPAPPSRAPPRRVPYALSFMTALVAVIGLAGIAPGWLRREAREVGAGDASGPVLAFMLTRPGFSSGSRPVSFAPAVIATLAGPHLRHPLSLIPSREPCVRVRALLRRGWVVVRPKEYIPGLLTNFDAARCLQRDPPVYDDGTTVVYAPQNQ